MQERCRWRLALAAILLSATPVCSPAAPSPMQEPGGLEFRSAPGFGDLMVRVLYAGVVVVVVLAVVAAVLYYFGRLHGRERRSQSAVRMVLARRLDHRARIYVVDIEGRRYHLAAASDRVVQLDPAATLDVPPALPDEPKQ